jgi:hypothetical protein
MTNVLTILCDPPSKASSIFSTVEPIFTIEEAGRATTPATLSRVPRGHLSPGWYLLTDGQRLTRRIREVNSGKLIRRSSFFSVAADYDLNFDPLHWLHNLSAAFESSSSAD